MKGRLLSVLLLLVVVSCYKDKGSYDLHDINKISLLKKGSDTLVVNQFDRLQVEPLIKQSMHEDESNLSYRWAVYLLKEPITGDRQQELATTRDLDVQFGLSPADYTLLYTVTDNKTGVSEFKKYLLQVKSKLSEGWLMVSEDKSANRDIDLLHPEGYVIPTLLSSANPGYSIPKGLHSIRVLTTFFGASQDIYALGESDAVRVRYTDFSKMSELNEWFFESMPTHRPQDYAYDAVGMNMFYMDNGKIFSNQMDFRYGMPTPGDHNLAPFLYPQQSSDAALVYDQKSKRFLNYSGKVFKEFSSEGAFNMNNVGLTALFGGVAPDGQFSYIMKGDTDDYYVLRVEQGRAVGKYPIQGADNIKNIECAAFSGLYFHIYYSVGNELYLLDIPNNKSQLIYTFGSDEQVTVLTLKQSRSSFVSYSDNNRTLAVGTYNGAEGKVYTFKINNIGAFEGATFVQKYEGLQKPISLTYKNRK